MQADPLCPGQPSLRDQKACLVVMIQAGDPALHTVRSGGSDCPSPPPQLPLLRDSSPARRLLLSPLLGTQGSSPSSVANTVRLCQTRVSRSRGTTVRMVPSSGSIEKQRSGSEWGRMEYLGKMEWSWGLIWGRAGAGCYPSLPSVCLAGPLGSSGQRARARLG